MLEIRMARIEDLENMINLYVEQDDWKFRMERLVQDPTRTKEAEVLALAEQLKLKIDKSRVLLAYDDEMLAGMCSYYAHEREEEKEDTPGCIYVREFYCSQSYLKGRGSENGLIQKILFVMAMKAKALKIERMSIMINRSRKDQVREEFEKLGARKGQEHQIRDYTLDVYTWDDVKELL